MRVVGHAGVVVMILAVLSATPASAQGVRYSGQLSIYGVDIPPGWTQVDGGASVDAAFAPPGGIAYGSIWVGLTYSKGSLDAEADDLAENSSVGQRRRLSVDGMPCIFFASTGPRGERDNQLLCQFNVPFSEGTKQVTFFMGSSSRPQEYAAQTDIFWQTVNTLAWRGDVVAAKDAQDDQDDGDYDTDDAPGTWVLYVSPPGTAYANPRPPYEQWVVFQRYAGLASCLEARTPAHFRYWDSDRDLSMRVLNGICFNPDTQEIRGER